MNKSIRKSITKPKRKSCPICFKEFEGAYAIKKHLQRIKPCQPPPIIPILRHEIQNLTQLIDVLQKRLTMLESQNKILNEENQGLKKQIPETMMKNEIDSSLDTNQYFTAF